MRFKTRLKVDKVQHLLRVIQVLDKLERRCVLHLCPQDIDSVRIVLQADVAGSVAAYTLFKRSEWFESYRIESQNENQIGLEMDMQNLLRALRSASAADEILIKLSKKGVPVLTFEIRTPLGPILQDIPVIVLSAVRLAEFNEPEHEYIKGFTLPPLGKLHTVVDRMKGLSNELQLNARLVDQKASLSLRVLTHSVSVSTTYNDLSLASYDADEASAEVEDQPETADSSLDATVELKSFNRSLYGHQVQPTHAICFIRPSCVMVHLMVPWDVGITYYIPRKVTAA